MNPSAALARRSKEETRLLRRIPKGLLPDVVRITIGDRSDLITLVSKGKPYERNNWPSVVGRICERSTTSLLRFQKPDVAAVEGPVDFILSHVVPVAGLDELTPTIQTLIGDYSERYVEDQFRLPLDGRPLLCEELAVDGFFVARYRLLGRKIHFTVCHTSGKNSYRVGRLCHTMLYDPAENTLEPGRCIDGTAKNQKSPVTERLLKASRNMAAAEFLSSDAIYHFRAAVLPRALAAF